MLHSPPPEFESECLPIVGLGSGETVSYSSDKVPAINFEWSRVLTAKLGCAGEYA